MAGSGSAAEPAPGPPLGIGPLDPEEVVEEWRAALRERMRGRDAS